MDFYCIFFILLFSVIVSSDSDNIKIVHYNSNNPSEGTPVNILDPVQVAESTFNNEKDTFFYIHGWKDQALTLESSAQFLKYISITKYDANVFLVDWSEIASSILYPIVAEKVNGLGNDLGSMIWSLVENNGLTLDRTTIVGRCLGAHVAGVAGRVLDGEVAQIVGLDPAALGLLSLSPANSLSTSSAKFVQVIHTCGKLLGEFNPLGHADYYPNGGSEQYMCQNDSFGKCSHFISLDFYLESILSGNFKATKCSTYEKFKIGSCNNKHQSLMGGYILDKNATGTYFLDTNKFPPFAKIN